MSRQMKQEITYWAPGTSDGFGGKGYLSPVLLQGRWEDKTENVLTPKGDTIISRSRIFLSQSVAVGGMIALGDQTAFLSPGLSSSQAWEIRVVGKVPDLRSLRTLYTAYI